MKKTLAILTVCALMLCACGVQPDRQSHAPSITEALFEAKTPYIGDASALSEIINLLGGIPGAEDGSIEIKSDEEPYGLIRRFSGDMADEEVLTYQAAIMMCLVDNMDFVTYEFSDGELTFTREQFTDILGEPLSGFAQSIEKFEELRKTDFGSDSGDDFIALVGKTIIEYNRGMYQDGECSGEGHVIYDVLRTDDKVEVFAIASYGEYGFQNGNFVKISGSGVIPTKITYTPEYSFVAYEVPKDGSLYEESLKELFPEPLWDMALEIDAYDITICREQERAYAQTYLEEIGRSAVVGDYSDFEYNIPDIAADASNALLEDYSAYPYWIGTEEKIENGVRVVYETAWESANGTDGTVTYKKYNYDDKKVIEEKAVTVKDGKLQ
ncbi:MAG: DUF4825 domain-containing protein [Clostridia bacterium]|nr:DUF4825 domain-containing protein [Clostridia bacterium]